MDEFENKRGMVKVLMDMLKKSAGDEVSKGMEGKQVTLTPVPSAPVAEKPHQKESFDKGHMDKAMPMEAHGEAMPMKMAEGGMAPSSDEPEREMPSDLPSEPGAEHMEAEGEMEDEDEDNNSSAFAGLMKKKKK